MMWTAFESLIGTVFLNRETDEAVKSPRLFTGAVKGKFIRETAEIVWSDDECREYDALVRTSPRERVSGIILTGHRQDTATASVSRRSVCLSDDRMLFWWNHWSEFNKLVYAEAVTYAFYPVDVEVE